MLKLKSLQAQEKLVAKQLKSVPTVYPDYKIQQKKIKLSFNYCMLHHVAQV